MRGGGVNAMQRNVRRIVAASRNEGNRPRAARRQARSSWILRQSIRPEWWHTFPDGQAHFTSASETPEGMGFFRRRITLRDVSLGKHPTRGRMGRGEGGNGLPHRAANASAAVRGSRRTCLPGATAARGRLPPRVSVRVRQAVPPAGRVSQYDLPGSCPRRMHPRAETSKGIPSR